MKIDLKYIIAFIIVVVAAGVFFIYMDYAEEKELAEFNLQEFKRITQVAKKSVRAGLVDMGKALNKYKQKNGIYPAKLSALYPEYIPVKEFIDEIEWHYQLKGKDFYLQKTIATQKNNALKYAIGSDLKLIQKPAMMAAATSPASTPPVRTQVKPIQKTSAAKTTPTAKTQPQLIAKTRIQTAFPAATGPRRSRLSQENSLPKAKPVVTEELSAEDKFIQRLGNNFLVWKSDDGTLGFSNIQYPNDNNIQILVKGRWRSVNN